jgi:hypothetical protein
MPDSRDGLAGLEHLRAELYEQLSRVGDFRRGSLNEVRRKCGRPNCACAQPGHPGHGPQYNLTRSAGGRTVTRHLKPGPELDKIRAEVAEYERFRALVGQFPLAMTARRSFRPSAVNVSPGTAAVHAASRSAAACRSAVVDVTWAGRTGSRSRVRRSILALRRDSSFACGISSARIRHGAAHRDGSSMARSRGWFILAWG